MCSCSCVHRVGDRPRLWSAARNFANKCSVLEFCFEAMTWETNLSIRHSESHSADEIWADEMRNLNRTNVLFQICRNS